MSYLLPLRYRGFYEFVVLENQCYNKSKAGINREKGFSTGTMVTILHTADLHLEKPFLRLGSKGKERRRGLRTVLSRICEMARESSDLLVIVGDLFEHDYITPDTFNFIREQLRSLQPMKVFIAPGNHDPCVHDSPYLNEPWPENVHVFKRNVLEKVELPEFGLTVHGIANTAFQDRTRYLKDYRVDDDGNIHLILFHGSDIESVPPQYEQETWFPFTESELRATGADYVALGHYHSYRPISENGAHPIGAYPGCPEAVEMGDSGDKYVLQVQLEKGQVRLAPVQVSGYCYEDIEIDCTDMSSRDHAIGALRNLAAERGWEKTIVRATLKGEVEEGFEFHTDEMREALAKDIFYLEPVDQTDIPYDLKELSSRRDALGEFVRKTMHRLEKETPDDAEREKLRLALLLGIDAFRRNEVREP